MKISKPQKENVLFIIVILVILFTPIGGLIREYGSRLLASSPHIENNVANVTLSNYEWKLKGINTENYNFNDAKGKVVFINFWATWCPPCRAEMPSIQDLYNEYSDSVVFIFISDEKEKTINNFLGKKKYTLPTYNQINYAPKAFKVTSIPATYILNKKGEIVVQEVGAVDWNSKKVRAFLDKLLEE